MSDFIFRTVPTSVPVTPEMRAWQDAVRLGFGMSDGPDEAYDHWAVDVVADGYRLDAAYATPPALAPVAELEQPVATFASGAKTVNVGGGRLEPALFISEVTVRTTHRRRGLLKRLMLDALTRAKADGLTLATLTASEGAIYGRFGFGISTEHRSVRLDTGPRLAWSREVEPRVVLTPAADSQAVREEVFARFHARTRGSHERPHFYAKSKTGVWEYDTDSAHRELRVAVHWDADGAPDGVLTYAVNESEQSVRVWDFVTAGAEAELALWQYLGSIDLVTGVVFRHLGPDSPLRWALADPRVLTTTGVEDYTWTRLLDVPGALQARGWDADGEARLEVIDPLGFAAGTWRVAASAGRAEVTRSTDAPLRVEARALGSLYFGLADARALAQAGQIHGPDDEVARLAALFRTDTAPYNLAAF